MGKCTHIDYKQKKPKSCTLDEVGTSGLCVKHGGKVAPKQDEVNTIVYVTIQTKKEPEENFFGAATAAPYADHIEMLSKCRGQSGGSPMTIKGCEVTHHTWGRSLIHTTVFYVWQGSTIKIFGLAKHIKDNSHYKIAYWYDGSEDFTVEQKKK